VSLGISVFGTAAQTKRGQSRFIFHQHLSQVSDALIELARFSSHSSPTLRKGAFGGLLAYAIEKMDG
jgi:hypothetical protein